MRDDVVKPLAQSQSFLLGEFGIEQPRDVFLPGRAVESWCPVLCRGGFPGQPRQARFFREEVHPLETLRLGEAQGAGANEHDVVGALQYESCHLRGVLDVAQRGHCARPPRRPVHHAGVEFHFAIFIGQAAIAHRVVVGVVFDHGHHGDGGIERVSALAQDLHAALQRPQPVRAGDDHRAGGLCGCGSLQPRQALGGS